jgi:hypothetical protein
MPIWTSLLGVPPPLLLSFEEDFALLAQRKENLPPQKLGWGFLSKTAPYPKSLNGDIAVPIYDIGTDTGPVDPDEPDSEIVALETKKSSTVWFPGHSPVNEIVPENDPL